MGKSSVPDPMRSVPKPDIVLALCLLAVLSNQRVAIPCIDPTVSPLFS